MADPWGDEFEEAQDELMTAMKPAHVESSKEFVLYIVDIRENMLKLHSTEDGEQGLSFLQCAFRLLAVHFKKRASNADPVRLGVLLMGCGPSLSFSSFPGLHMLVEMDLPSARSIRTLTDIADNPSVLLGLLSSASGAPFAWQAAGSACPVGEALHASYDALFRDAQAKSSDEQLLMFMTTDDRPACLREHAVQRARDCWAAHQAIRLIGFRPAGSDFNVAAFWEALLADDGDEEDDAATVSTAGSGRRMKPTHGAGFTPSDGSLEDLESRTVQRSSKKRVYARVVFTLADGVHVGVGVYNNLYPAKKPSAGHVTAMEHHPVKAASRYLDSGTGEQLTDAGTVRYAEVGKAGGKVFFTHSEAKDVRVIVGDGRGLRLLGFKPVSAVRAIDNVRSPMFIYPLEGDVHGSSLVYRALWRRMLDRGVAAIARFEPRDHAAPHIVALIAAEGVVNENGTQASPPGMYAVQLPYADDIRQLALPEEDAVDTDAAMEAAADELVQALTVDYAALRTSISNPALQKFYRNLEQLALQSGKDAWNDAKDDTSASDKEGMQSAAMEQLQAFVTATGAAAGASAPPAKKSAAGTKRRRGEDDGEDAPVADAGIDWPAELRTGRIAKHNMDELKAYLRAHKLRLGGRKDELVTRVEEHLRANGGAAAPAPAAAAAGPEVIALDDDDDEPVEDVRPRKRAAPAKKPAASRRKVVVLDDDDDE